MDTIKGLLVKDLLLLKSYRKNIFIWLFIFGIMILFQKEEDMSSIGVIMIMVVFSILSISTFSYDEKSKSDKFIASLPISRKEFVQEKYILSILFLLIGILFAFLYDNLLELIVIGKIVNIDEIFSTILGGMVALSLLQAVQIPCILKYGAEKGRMQIYAIGMILFLIGILLMTVLKNVQFDFTIFQFLEKIMPFLCILTTTFIYFISYKISYAIYQKKEL